MKQKFYVSLFAFVITFFLVGSATAQIKQATVDQIKLLLQEKESRTPSQRKMASQLLQASREQRGQKMANGVSLLPVKLKTDDAGFLSVDISANVTDALLSKITALGGRIIYPSKQFKTIRAKVPLTDVEKIAAFTEVTFIKPAVKSRTVGAGNHQNNVKGNLLPLVGGNTVIPSIVRKQTPATKRLEKVKKQIEEYVMTLGTGSVNSEGDHPHRADDARNTFGYAGQGIKIGVLSDSYNAGGTAPANVLNGNLPGIGNPIGNTTPVTVLQDYPGATDEGQAMVQIVHDIAPKAQLFFATADASEAGFAANIIALRNVYHCDVIIDDVGYFDEPSFQDGIVAQAVNTVSLDGAMYFSSAGNAGSVKYGLGSIYEADFNNTGSPAFTGSSKGGTIHNFGTAGAPINGDIITAPESVTAGDDNYYSLNWADPYGASNNDYDLFLVSAAGVVKASSTDIQSGSSDPFEIIDAPVTGTPWVSGDRLVVFKTSTAAVRAFHLSTVSDGIATLAIATPGSTDGHPCAAYGFCVAATPAPLAYPNPFVATNTVEDFSSDGPRRVFYNPDNTPVSGNFTFASGGYTTRQKPDITAADGVSTTVPGFTPFYGTSAAAPHAGAIAALVLSASNTLATKLTTAQVRNILNTTALDIETPGYDYNSGYGILQAYQAVQAVGATPLPNITVGTTTVTEGSFSNGNGGLDAGETGNITVQVKNLSLGTATNVTATVVSNTTGVTVTKGTFNYGTLAPGASATNSVPFTFAINSTVACGTNISFSVVVSFGGGGPSPASGSITATMGEVSTFGSIAAKIGTPAAAGTNYTSSTGTQIGRVSRGGTNSTCATTVPYPGLGATTGARQYDAYVFTNNTGASQCFTVTLSGANTLNLFTVAYYNTNVNTTAFVPSNVATNYLAEPAQSTSVQQYSFTIPSGKKFTVVVHAVDSLTNPGGNEIGAAYNLAVTYITCAAKPTCTSVVITTPSIPAGAVGTPYIQHFAATGGSGAYVDSLLGNLPAGLKFAGDSLFGTPTQAGTFALTLKVIDPAGCPTATMPYTLVISGVAPAAITATAGTPQSTFIYTAFATALQATVKDVNGNLLPGVNVIFTAPTTGASGTFANGTATATVVTDANGVATAPTFTANATNGTYNVTASVNGVTPSATFNLTNTCPPTIVTSNADSGPGTLRNIIAFSCANPVITFDPSITSIVLTSGEIALTKAVTIVGPGADKLSISGNFSSRIFNIAPGRNVIDSISGITFRDGFAQSPEVLGGGAILVSTGTIKIGKCVFTNNDAEYSQYGEGGAIDNEGGTLTIDKSTFYNNASYADGGGITQYAGSLTMTNSTLANNFATEAGSAGGGIYTYSTASLTNTTIYGNSASFGGNILKDNGNTTLKNCIVGGGVLNNVGGAGPDIYGAIISSDYNLFQTTTGGTLSSITTHNIYNTNPKLLPLANYGGTVPTMLPMSSSVTINAGDPTLLATATDERGFVRKIGTSADIGAVETNYTATITAGTPQTTLINNVFANSLRVNVTESGNNISGDTVTFTAPATGASATFPNGLKTIAEVTDASGVARDTALANGITGTYNVVASIGSAFPTLSFVLTNNFVPVAFNACPNVNLIISRPGYNAYNGEGVMMYNMDTASGAATVIPGGPLKDSLTGKNIDVNGAGVNGMDGFVYAIRDTINTGGTAAAPMFYRIGGNYANTLLGNLPTPAATSPDNLSLVVPSAGTFDDQGNYYYIAMTGNYTAAPSFTPTNYYICKVANVAALTGGTGMLTATFNKLALNNGTADFKASIFKTITSASGSGAGAGFQDIAYSNLYRSIYVYTSFPTTGSPNYSFQLMSINPATGSVVFYSPITTFGAANNEVAGISATASGNLRIFMTNGDIYKPSLSGISFTNTMQRVGTSGVPLAGVSGSVRGDLASCGTGSTSLPATQAIVPPSITIGLPNQIVAYPNPAKGLTTIAVGQSLNNATVRLMGSAGNIIAEKSGVSGYTFQFDMTGKAGGMYMVEVIQGGNIQQVKIVVP